MYSAIGQGPKLLEPINTLSKCIMWLLTVNPENVEQNCVFKLIFIKDNSHTFFNLLLLRATE